MKTVIVGDVHGCLAELKQLLASFKISKTDRVYIVGDFLDRGPYGPELIRYCIQNNIGGVLGNHDDKHIRYRKHLKNEQATGKKIPMRMGPQDLEQHMRISDDELGWLEHLPLVVDHGNYIMTHAGFEPHNPGIPNRSCLNLRYLSGVDGKPVSLGKDLSQPEGSVFWADRWHHHKEVYFGHSVLSMTTPVTFHRGQPNACHALDTGCCFGGWLSAAILESGKFVNYIGVTANAAYRPHGHDLAH